MTPAVAATTKTLQGDAALVKAVGVGGLTASIINIIVGGGIFLLPATLAMQMGAAAPLTFLAGACAIVPITLCFAAAASRAASTGGPYTYVERAFGPFPGFIAGALMWICNWASSAGVAAGLAGQVATAFPALAEPIPRAAFLIAVYALLATLNGLGVRTGTRAIVVLATLKLTPLFLLVAIGLFFVDWNNLYFAAFPGFAALGPSMVAVMFAYSGVETALIPSGEVRDPSRDVPRAAIAALVLVVLLYLGVQIVAQGMLGDALKVSRAPIADTAGAIFPWGFKILLATASISMLGFLQGNVLATSRLIYALGRDRYLLSVLGRITVTHRVPLVAIVTHAVLACTLAIAGNFNWLILVSGGANCLVYVAVAIAAWQLQRKRVVEHGEPFVLPGGALIPAISCLALGLILFYLQKPEWLAIAGALAVIVIVYGVQRLLRRTPT